MLKLFSTMEMTLLFLFMKVMCVNLVHTIQNHKAQMWRMFLETLFPRGNHISEYISRTFLLFMCRLIKWWDSADQVFSPLSIMWISFHTNCLHFSLWQHQMPLWITLTCSVNLPLMGTLMVFSLLQTRYWAKGCVLGGWTCSVSCQQYYKKNLWA